MQPNCKCNVCGEDAFEMFSSQECATPDCINFSREFAEAQGGTPNEPLDVEKADKKHGHSVSGFFGTNPPKYDYDDSIPFLKTNACGELPISKIADMRVVRENEQFLVEHKTNKDIVSGKDVLNESRAKGKPIRPVSFRTTEYFLPTNRNGDAILTGERLHKMLGLMRNPCSVFAEEQGALDMVTQVEHHAAQMRKSIEKVMGLSKACLELKEAIGRTAAEIARLSEVLQGLEEPYVPELGDLVKAKDSDTVLGVVQSLNTARGEAGIHMGYEAGGVMGSMYLVRKYDQIECVGHKLKLGDPPPGYQDVQVGDLVSCGDEVVGVVNSQIREGRVSLVSTSCIEEGDLVCFSTSDLEVVEITDEENYEAQENRSL